MRSDPLAALKSTEGMVDYDNNSATQRQLVKLHDERIRTLTKRLGRVSPEFKIVDYGCGPGTTAIEAVRPAIDTYRSCYPEVPISVCHADQPGNDWNALIEIATGPSGYRNGVEDIRTEAVVGSSKRSPRMRVSFCNGLANRHSIRGFFKSWPMNASTQNWADKCRTILPGSPSLMASVFLVLGTFVATL